MRVLIAALIMVTSLSAMTEKEIQIKRIKMEGRQVREHRINHQKRADKYKVLEEAADKKVKELRLKLNAMYTKHRCRLKDECNHKRGLDCYKMKRTMDRTLALIKKEEQIKEKYKKLYVTEKKFSDKKMEREKELIKMLKELGK